MFTRPFPSIVLIAFFTFTSGCAYSIASTKIKNGNTSEVLAWNSSDTAGAVAFTGQGFCYLPPSQVSHDSKFDFKGDVGVAYEAFELGLQTGIKSSTSGQKLYDMDQAILLLNFALYRICEANIQKTFSVGTSNKSAADMYELVINSVSSIMLAELELAKAAKTQAASAAAEKATEPMQKETSLIVKEIESLQATNTTLKNLMTVPILKSDPTKGAAPDFSILLSQISENDSKINTLKTELEDKTKKISEQKDDILKGLMYPEPPPTTAGSDETGQ